MNIADRIQNLRKVKGISQEELADKVGVTRQAVSKWESEQSTPDVEKIIIMSDYFEVTTDYLLKGIEPKAEETKKKLDAGIFSIVGTALNFMGLIAAIMIWHEKQVEYSVAVGLMRGNSFITYGLCWLMYFGICIVGDLILVKGAKISS